MLSLCWNSCEKKSVITHRLDAILGNDNRMAQKSNQSALLDPPPPPSLVQISLFSRKTLEKQKILLMQKNLLCRFLNN